jgi:hypothetical protein
MDDVDNSCINFQRKILFPRNFLNPLSSHKVGALNFNMKRLPVRWNTLAMHRKRKNGFLEENFKKYFVSVTEVFLGHGVI